MAVAKTRTQLPLDVFAKYAGIHPLHFNQITLPSAPSRTCGDVLLQYSWQQADKVGREELAAAIADAENIIQEQLNYPLSPVWIADERVPYPRGILPEGIRSSVYDNRGFTSAVKVRNGYVISGGAEAWSVVALGAAIVYTDSDSDGYLDTATVSVPTTVTSAEEIAVRYPGLGVEWEIRPVTVSIAGGTATIRFRREQCVLANILESFDTYGVDGMDDSKFLTTVDVYRHYNDPSQQVNFVWENLPFCACNGEGCESCQFAMQTGCILVRDERQGLVAVQNGVYDAATGSYAYEYPSDCRAADRLRLWYRAGKPYVAGTMDPVWGRAVTYLALSILDRPLCQCNSLRAFTAHWAENLGEMKSAPSGASSFRLGRLIENPIGTTRAAIHAWRLILRNKLGEGVVSA